MDAIKLLTNDHRTVDKLFDRFESLGSGASAEKKQIVQDIIRELSIHASIEEQVLYPGVREVVPDGDGLAEEALDEHQDVKEALAELDKMDPADSGFDAKVRSVIQDVRHHASEEESEMFPKLASAIPQKKLDEWGDRMEKAKKIAPTRPHPMAPNTPPGNLMAGPMAAVVDRARDAVTGRGKKASSRKSSSRKKTGAKKSTARKATSKRTGAKKATSRKATSKRSGAKKATSRKSASKSSAARKSTGRKTSARKSTSRKGTAKKSSSRKTSSRKGASRKSTSRKSTTRKSSARKSTSKRTGSRKTSGRKSGGRRSS